MPETKPAWTAGPWRVGDMNERFRKVYVYSGDYAEGDCIAEVRCGSVLLAELQANARLIAKAPEMAELLRELTDTLKWIAADAAPGWNYLSDAARTVIPKAERLLAEIEGKP